MKLKISWENIYLISLIVFLFVTILSTTTFLGDKLNDTFLTFIRLICVLIVGLKFLICDLNHISKKRVLLLLAIGIFLCINSLLKHNILFPQYYILILGSRNISFKKIAKFVLISELTFVLFIMFLDVFQIVPNPYSTFKRGDIIRQSFGFKFNTLPQYFWFFTLLYLYLKYDNLKIFHFVFLILFHFILYYFTNSRNELFCSLFSIILMLNYRYRISTKLHHFILFISRYSMIILSFLFGLLSYFYDPSIPWLERINKFSSNRLQYTNLAIHKYKFHFFANVIVWIGLTSVYAGSYTMSDYNYVDSSYLQILLDYGFLFFSLFLYGFYRLAKYHVKIENGLMCYIILCIAVHSFNSPQLLMIAYNIFLLQFVEILLPNKKEKRKYNE